MTNDSNDTSFVICHLNTQMTNDLSHLINLINIEYYIIYFFLFLKKSFYLLLGMATVGYGQLSVGHGQSKIFDRLTVVITETLTAV